MQIYVCSRTQKKVPRSELREHLRQGGSGDLTLYRGAGGKLKGFFRGILLLVLAVALAGLAVLLGQWSFQSLAQMRQLERIPAVAVRGMLPGEVNLHGRVRQGEQILQAPNTGTPSVVYRYVVERQERDSDGDTKWRTVRDETRFVPFLLADETGEALVRPSGAARLGLRVSWRETRGDMRYTEYRIVPGDEVFLFGYAERGAGEGFVVGFDRQGFYTPILSVLGETRERSGMAGVSIAKVWLGMVVLALGVSLLISVFRLHRLLVYFSLLSTLVAVYMVVLGLRMMRADLAAASDRLALHEQRSAEEAGRMLQARGEAWTGDWETFPLAMLTPGRLTEADRLRMEEIRLNLALAKARAAQQQEAFPERLFLRRWDVARPEPLRLTEAEAAALAARGLTAERATIPPILGWVLIGVSALVGVGCFGGGFRKVRFKRCMENLPTSPSLGAVWGLTELKGIATVAEGADCLKGPLSGLPCVQYHYTVEERRGSGKKSRWVTILNEQRRIPFLLEDGEGKMLVDPAGAECYSTHHSHRGKLHRRYSERRLEVGDPLYAIGECRLEPVSGERLYLCKPKEDADAPFYLANLSEQELMLRLARSGIGLLNVSFAAMVLAALLLFGLSGSFAATDYLAAALTAPLFLTAVTLMLHYNDLVFLRERVRRNASNIDVALKKRHDLVPRLAEITRGLAQHERSLQEELGALRNLYAQGVSRDPEVLAPFLQAETGLLQQMLLRVEANPQLVSDGQTARMMRSLVLLENEVSLMRSGYNDAVERYHTRIQSFPDVIFAKLFGFQPFGAALGEGELLQVPEPVQTLWEAEQTGGGEAGTALLAAAAGETVVLTPEEKSLCQRFLSMFAHEPENPLLVLEAMEAMYGAVRKLRPAAYRELRREVAAAVEADGRLSFFEWALLQSMSLRLDQAFGLRLAEPVRVTDPAEVEEAMRKLLSLVAGTEAGAETAPAAFAAGWAVLEMPAAPGRPEAVEVDNLAAFEALVDEFRHASPEIRSRMFAACEAAVRTGGTFTVQQHLFLLALADAWELPRPDLREDGKTS